MFFVYLAKNWLYIQYGIKELKFGPPSLLGISFTCDHLKECFALLGFLREEEIMLSDKSVFKSTPKTLAKQANKALFSLLKTLLKLSYPKPSLMCYLFDLLVKPVMDYASKIWNFTVLDNNDSLEIIHRKFCKFAFGISTNAANLAIYGELGRPPSQYTGRSKW